ncbi:MAG: cobalamin-dependent protein [Gemmatimonadaceae bacterium]
MSAHNSPVTSRDAAAGSRARVLLVSTNTERQPYPVVPNGLAAVASSLEHAGHEVELLDLCFTRAPAAAAGAAARRFKPDVVGVSVRNIDNSDAVALQHYTPEAAAVVRELRAASPPGSRLIAGGAAFGVAPEALFTELGVDYAVAGDGERASVALVAALAAGEEPKAIPGLVRRGAGAITFTPPGEDADLDSLPPPALARWVDLKRYQRHGATVPVQTKRGCVYRCVYCTGTVAPCRW